MRTIKLVISFDGTDYRGWQRQQNGPTVQEEIERAVSLICNKPTSVHGAGRTDAGVHALGMTASFTTTSRIECEALLKGLNSVLPDVIRIIGASDMPNDFHARYSTRGKTYLYEAFTGPVLCPIKRNYCAHIPHQLCLADMESCLGLITGTHDFSSFEAVGSRDKTNLKGRGAVRTIFTAQLIQPEQNIVQLYFTGDGFLRHMVRNLAGTILEVGRHKRKVREFEQILAGRDRNLAGATAPARGLTLLEVHYKAQHRE